MKKQIRTILVFCFSIICLASCGGGGGSGGGELVCLNYTSTATCASVWTQHSPTGTSPSERYSPGVAYDATNNILISFGGYDGTNYLNDIFVLTNASGTDTPAWTELAPVGGPPAARAFSAVAYNSNANNFILFGGSDSAGIYMDLWLLSNANGTGGAPVWTNPAIAGTAPSSRAIMAFAYDETNDTLILFGGRACGTSTCTLYNNVYLITNATTAPTWQQLTPSGTAPSARLAASAVYDSTDNRLIIFGGSTSTSRTSVASSSKNDTWVLSNANGTGETPSWTNLSPSASTENRYSHSAVYDPTQDRMIVFGGVNASNTALNEVSILLDSRGTSPTWSTYVVCNPVPTARRYLGIAYAQATNRMIIFAGEAGGGAELNDVWDLANANGNPATAVASVNVSVESDELCDGYLLQLIPSAYDISGNELEDFLYSCVADDTSVATVDEECLVTGVGPGTVRITVTINGISEEIILTIVSADGGGGTEGTETWSGTYEIVDVFNGVWVCTYTTTGNISMSITNEAGILSGTSYFTNIQESVVSEDPTLSCPPDIHSSEGTLAGTVLSNGNYEFSFFDLDVTNVAPFTATISGNTMTASGTKQSSMDEYTFTINATRQ
ncbi:MAG: kelch repeat-containing protein [Pseudomonadota bacterium]